MLISFLLSFDIESFAPLQPNNIRLRVGKNILTPHHNISDFINIPDTKVCTAFTEMSLLDTTR